MPQRVDGVAGQGVEYQSFHEAKPRVTANDYRHLEKCLSGCEDIATDLSTWSPRDLRIRDDIRAILEKVVVERIRAEERKSSPAPD